MAEHTARILETGEHRAADGVFRSALHEPPATDEQWERVRHAHEASRAFGVFDGDAALIGTTRGWDDTLVTPDGGEVADAPVTGVGVRSDRTRRGVLTELMRAQLRDCAERGVVTANLHASEGGIYGRFGYGPATFARKYTVDRRRAVLRSDLPAGGDVQRLDTDTAVARLPGVYSALQPGRPGNLGRAEPYWTSFRAVMTRSESVAVTALHHGVDGADGFVVYEVQRSNGRAELTVRDLQAAGPAAFTGLWRYLLGVDLVDDIVLLSRPLDEPTALLFTDPRVVAEEHSEDETWLRLVDVETALGGLRGLRGLGGLDVDEPLVIEVSDGVLEFNSGRYRITGEGVVRCDEPADLRLDVDTLAMIYLGGWGVRPLVDFGRIACTSPEAVDTAERAFGARRAPWCGTFF